MSGGDVDAIKDVPPDVRVPYLEFILSADCNRQLQLINEAHNVPANLDLDKMKSPRMITSHLYYEQLSKEIETKKPKIVYVARNPKDTAVSYYNFSKSLPFMETFDTFGEFLEAFYEARHNLFKVNWAKHVLQVWERKDQENVMFLKYEDVKQDFGGTIKKLSKFLNVELDEGAMHRIAHHCDIETMRQNPLSRKANFISKFNIDPATSPFVGKGKVGGWKNVFTVAQNKRFDQMYKQWMEASDLEFRFD
ncbi:sulfotransferase 1C4-like [Glandiceps talaboti]